ncbi:class I SAM-dependent methyltransferase [Streptomyces sp. NPDC002754]
MSETTVARFYDELADDYHLIYPDWDASLRRQGAALDAVIGRDGAEVLDCSCGIGTQAIGLALHGHRVTGTDLSPRAAARAAREAASRGLPLPTAAADMRQLPFADSRFDVVVCADNSLPHLLTAQDVRTALTEMRRVLRPDGLLLVSTRPYEDLLREHPTSMPPQVHWSEEGRTVTFQLWHWHDDGERYDLEHFQLLPDAGLPDAGLPDAGDGWRVRVRLATYWALGQERLATLAAEAGFVDGAWRDPQESGFFQPLFVARAGAAQGRSAGEDQADVVPAEPERVGQRRRPRP